MTNQLPAMLQPGALTTPADTYMVSALTADAGDQAGWRYVEFFSANIRNPHTRRAYAPRLQPVLTPGASNAASPSPPSDRTTWRGG